MSRKNIHGKAGVRFKAGYTVSKDRNMLRNVSTDLIIYGRVEVTEKVAKQLKSSVDHLITLAKRGDLHARRQAAAYVRAEIANDETGATAVQKLFSDIAPRYAERNGGYTRILKVGPRRGDAADMVVIELV